MHAVFFLSHLPFVDVDVVDVDVAVVAAVAAVVAAVVAAAADVICLLNRHFRRFFCSVLCFAGVHADAVRADAPHHPRGPGGCRPKRDGVLEQSLR